VFAGAIIDVNRSLRNYTLTPLTWSEKMDHRYLRVVLLADRRTVHNAFFDRSFKP
jgi:hypothetical protein